MELDATAFLRLHTLAPMESADAGTFTLESGDRVEVATAAPGVFRVRIGQSTCPDYGIVVGRTEPCKSVRTTERWCFESGDATLELTDHPLRFRLRWRGETVLESITDQHFRGWTRLPAFGRTASAERWMASLALGSAEAVYGLGEKFGPLNKRGQLLHSEVHDALGVNTELSYKNTPFAWSPGAACGAWGVFVNTPATVHHGVGHPGWSHRSYVLIAEDDALDLFLFAAAAPADIIAAYTALTGKVPPVPRWSLGLWVSRAYYRTPEEAAEVARELRARQIPCDVLTLDGRAAWNVDTRFDFQWDPERFPDPAAAIAAIKARDLRVCVWEYPYVSIRSALYRELAAREYLLKREDGEAYVFGWDTSPGSSPFGNVLTPLPESGIVDFTNPDAYAWWRDAHAPLFAAGVDVIKSDFGEHVPPDAVAHNGDRGQRLRNVYPLLYNACVYDATARFQRSHDDPPIVWSRSGWAGEQRYPMGWGGDPQSDWEGLAASIRGGLSWGMSGNPYHSSDIGGFYGATQPSPELYVRWLQAGVFSSHMRLHGIGAREPWAFGDEIEAIARRWIEFRYRLIPYLYSVMRQAVSTSLPVMRAMPLVYPDDRRLADFETQFMCGAALLIAPIVRQGGEAEVALPPGRWYHVFSGERYDGDRLLAYRAELQDFPVFGKEGEVLPLGPVVQSTSHMDSARMLDTLWLFGAPSASHGDFAQFSVDAPAGQEATVRIDADLAVRTFGDAHVQVIRRS
ncbi:MAG: alpha-xylosidase [Pseudomonadota bacterium]|nr:alpha-xylosidase [Pseudomonadota bacterium]